MAPQLTSLASWSGLSRLLAATHSGRAAEMLKGQGGLAVRP